MTTGLETLRVRLAQLALIANWKCDRRERTYIYQTGESEPWKQFQTCLATFDSLMESVALQVLADELAKEEQMLADALVKEEQPLATEKEEPIETTEAEVVEVTEGEIPLDVLVETELSETPLVNGEQVKEPSVLETDESKPDLAVPTPPIV